MKPASAPAAEDQAPPPASETRPASLKVNARDALQSVREHEDPELAAALLEAGARYAGDDGSQEIADIQAGRHPLQRAGHPIDAWTQFEAKLATIRARRGE